MSEDWGTLLTDNPKVLWGLVADVVKAVKAGEGERRTGRRPAVSVGSLDELYDVLFPVAFASKPFSEAFQAALDERSMSHRAFAKETGWTQSTVSRLISGQLEPTVLTMELLADRLNVRPTYFVEYRALKIGQLVTDVFLADPLLSADAVRRLMGVPA